MVLVQFSKVKARPQPATMSLNPHFLPDLFQSAHVAHLHHIIIGIGLR